MTEGLLLGILGSLFFSHLVAFALGRLMGIESAFATLRRSEQRPGDWPTALQGDLPNVPVHARGVSDAGA